MNSFFFFAFFYKLTEFKVTLTFVKVKLWFEAFQLYFDFDLSLRNVVSRIVARRQFIFFVDINNSGVIAQAYEEVTIIMVSSMNHGILRQLKHTHSLSLSLSITLSHTHYLSLSHTLSLSHSHTHTHPCQKRQLIIAPKELIYTEEKKYIYFISRKS